MYARQHHHFDGVHQVDDLESLDENGLDNHLKESSDLLSHPMDNSEAAGSAVNDTYGHNTNTTTTTTTTTDSSALIMPNHANTTTNTAQGLSQQHPSRRSYTVEYKLQVIEYAKGHTIRSTAAAFGISRRNVSTWKNDEAKFRQILRTCRNGQTKRKLHPGPTSAARSLGAANRHRARAIFIDLLGTTVDWHKSVTKCFQRLRTTTYANGVPWGSVTSAWSTLVDRSLDKIRAGTLPFMTLEAVLRQTLHTLMIEFQLEFLPNEGEMLIKAWEKGLLWDPCIVETLELLQKRHTMVYVGRANLSLALRIARQVRLSFDAMLSPDILGQYPPESQVYYKAAELIGIPLGDCTVLTSHPSALSVCHQLGMRTCFIRRREEAPLVTIDIETYSNVIVLTISEAGSALLSNRKTARNVSSEGGGVSATDWGF